MAGEKKLAVAASADVLVGADDSNTETVEVPEWGAAIRIRSLTRGEARKIGADDMTPEQAEVYVLSTACVEPVLTEAQASSLINDKSFGATEKVLNRILEVSGLVPGFRPGS